MATDLSDKIEELADKPRNVSSDAGSVGQHSLQDLIAADKYLAQKTSATANPKRMGIRMGVLRAPEHY